MTKRIQELIEKIQSWPRIIRWPLGAVCLILGIAGLFLPFLQGIFLLAAGIVLFGIIEHSDLEKVSERLTAFKQKFLRRFKK